MLMLLALHEGLQINNGWLAEGRERDQSHEPTLGAWERKREGDTNKWLDLSRYG